MVVICISLATNDETTFSNWKKTEPIYSGEPKEKTEMQEEDQKNVAAQRLTEKWLRESGQKNQMMLMWPENSRLDLVPLVIFQ